MRNRILQKNYFVFQLNHSLFNVFNVVDVYILIMRWLNLQFLFLLLLLTISRIDVVIQTICLIKNDFWCTKIDDNWCRNVCWSLKKTLLKIWKFIIEKIELNELKDFCKWTMKMIRKIRILVDVIDVKIAIAISISQNDID